METKNDSFIGASKSDTGLSNEDAEHLLDVFGENTVTRKSRATPFLIFLKAFSSPLLIILIAIASVSFFVLGERMNALIISVMILISAIADFFNTWRSENAVEKLIEKVKTLSRVRRNGKEIDIDARHIVPGDIMLLSAGSLITADAEILEARDFFVNQSAITGESFPIEKYVAHLDANAKKESAIQHLLDREDVIFMGTSVVTGFATARVVSTGFQTEYGKIAASLGKKNEETDFERNIRLFSTFVMRINIVFASIVLLANTLVGREFIDSLTFSVAIAIGLTPELLPVMLSISLSRGSVRMAKKHAIVKRLSSIQNFGSMNILCTDKTGTLTEDKITLIKHIDATGNNSEDVFRYSYINSVYQTSIKSPLDRAIQEHKTLDISEYEKIDEVPFDFVRRRESLVVSYRGEKLLMTKGAPENVFDVVSTIQLGEGTIFIDEKWRESLKSLYNSLSQDGFRVLAIATKKLDVDDYVYDIADESNMIFVGFAAFLDPPKKDSAKALKELSQLGIEIKILTGDSGVLTEKVCRDLHIPIKGIALGKDIDTFSNAEVAKFASRTTIFARVSPAEKERIIRALREIPGNVVGYMGDGINDVTALVASDVGISVANAVPVAKDAASIILLEKDFSVLKEGVQEGRRTFQNTLKYIKMWISSNFGNMFSMMGASAFLPFLPMTPQQILLNNFLYDASQVGIPTDRVDKKSILRPSVWDFRDMKKFMIIFGVLSSAFDFLTFGFLLFVLQLEERSFQTGWFLQSLATQVLVVFVVRTKITPFFRSLPSTFLAVGVISILILGWTIALSPIGALFQFETLSFVAILGIISITVVYLLVVDRVKLYFEKF